MWFKQAQVYQLGKKQFSVNELNEKLAELAFTPCLPSLPYSTGWISPLDSEDEDAPFARMINGCIMISIQIEEKILPGVVVRQELNEKIKQIETGQDRKVRQKEKLSLKDEVTFSLLPRAFSKFTKIYAYIDTKKHLLFVASTSAPKIEQFMALFKRSVSEDVHALDIIKPALLFTHWLKTQDYPNLFAVENAAVLQDPNQQKRIIRCQHQDLFAQSIQAFIKEGCEAKQLKLSWHDRVTFVLAEDFSLKSIQYGDDILTQSKDVGETKQQRFDADFMIMSETLSSLLSDLIPLFQRNEVKEKNVMPA